MTNPNTTIDPASLTAFTATLAHLPADEIRKAKKLYMLNMIVDYKAQRQSTITMMVIFGIISIIPFFWIITIPGFFMMKKSLGLAREKLTNAADIWREDFGPDYPEIMQKIQALK